MLADFSLPEANFSTRPSLDRALRARRCALNERNDFGGNRIQAWTHPSKRWSESSKQTRSGQPAAQSAVRGQRAVELIDRRITYLEPCYRQVHGTCPFRAISDACALFDRSRSKNPYHSVEKFEDFALSRGNSPLIHKNRLGSNPYISGFCLRESGAPQCLLPNT